MMDEILKILLNAVLSGLMLAIGMIVGTRMSAKNMRKEMEDWMKQSEMFQYLKKFITDQTLIERATTFFDEATKLVSSPEAKSFFANATKALKEFSGAPEVEVKLPEKKKKS